MIYQRDSESEHVQGLYAEELTAESLPRE